MSLPENIRVSLDPDPDNWQGRYRQQVEAVHAALVAIRLGRHKLAEDVLRDSVGGFTQFGYMRRVLDQWKPGDEAAATEQQTELD